MVAEQAAERDAQRKSFIKSVTRSLEANHVPGLHLRRSLDEEDKQEQDAVLAAQAERVA